MHEFAHKLFCEWLGVAVYKVVYFQVKDLSGPVGYVLHAAPQTFQQTVWISIGPLIVNTGLTVVIGLIAGAMSTVDNLTLFLVWLGMSIGMHAFPSDQDMSHIGEISRVERANGGSPLFLLAFPFIALVWIANKLRLFWFDAIYAGAIMYLTGGLQ